MRLTLLMLMVVLSACATRPVPVSTLSTYADTAHRDVRLLVGAQPSQLDLQALAKAGTRSVLNLRTSGEMAELDFDETAVAKELGLRYRQIPVGGAEHPFTPEHLAAFAAEMEAADGSILLHCASGGRASQVYAAWLVKYRDHTPQQAMEKLKAFGAWPLPMERLLGEPLQVVFADESKQ